MLPTPGFHHLHLNSVDPDAAIDFYVRQFPRSTTTRWGGLPALAAPNDVLVLFSRVATAPATSPQTAIRHFGWHVTDTRASLETYTRRPDVTLLPLYTLPPRARAQAQARRQGAEVGVHQEGRRGAVEAHRP
jgi:catechol 2,3-dioxygenase-like lactoylglutathione lyase family enzyme